MAPVVRLHNSYTMNQRSTRSSCVQQRHTGKGVRQTAECGNVLSRCLQLTFLRLSALHNFDFSGRACQGSAVLLDK